MQNSLYHNSITQKLLLLLFSLCLVDMAVAASKGSIARSQFTTAIEDREPVDKVAVITNDITTVYYFADVRHMEGGVVTHNWIYNGQLISKKSFTVKGPRWRVYSQKELDPSMTGKWTVIVRDGQGWPLTAAVFYYVDSTSGEKNIILPLME
ncbi:hypothetical protein MNBD_GAMMA25-1214 [hydrothermal vent metagenome]|uniref:DUF2914 domain-containing protein n=1 Tax=hydrothermal vent metagenome TaxID=652676 RepID=A0A3B1BGN6_9ZZZZ